MDVTLYPPFGKLKYIHVSVDTFSGYIFASAHSGEAFTDVQNHLFAAFSQLGLPKAIKTDNGSAYTSSSFKQFCLTFGISHSTGIPYNSQGQAIVARSHSTLKTYLHKLKEGEILKGKTKYSPHMHLALTLYVLNFLNVDAVGKTAAERFWAPEPEPFLYARWKDPLTGQWSGPDPVLWRGQGFACIFPQKEETPRWLPLPCVRFTKENGPHLPSTTSSSTGPDGETPEEKGEESPIAYSGTNKEGGWRGQTNRT